MKYPVERVFQTMEEVDAYLSGDRITCLLCGKQLRRLAVHLPKVHNMTGDDYRTKYGIPWMRRNTWITKPKR